MLVSLLESSKLLFSSLTTIVNQVEMNSIITHFSIILRASHFAIILKIDCFLAHSLFLLSFHIISLIFSTTMLSMDFSIRYLGHGDFSSKVTTCDYE